MEAGEGLRHALRLGNLNMASRKARFALPARVLCTVHAVGSVVNGT